MTRKRDGKLHVFAGSFHSRDDACLYSEPQWEPEPDESVSDEEYAAWEDRNPTWRMRDHLGIGLNSDFIETIAGKGRYDYLDAHLTNAQDRATVRAAAGDANILVLIFPDAISDRAVHWKSTSRLIYCGAFDFGWHD